MSEVELYIALGVLALGVIGWAYRLYKKITADGKVSLQEVIDAVKEIADKTEEVKEEVEEIREQKLADVE